MKVQQRSSTDADKSVESLSDTIVGELVIGDSQYFVLPCDLDQQTGCASKTSQFSSQAGSFAKPSLAIGCLNILGKEYFVIPGSKSVAKANSDVLALLTERELQISNFVAIGASNKEIALKLDISEWTVSTHLRRVYGKLNVCNRAAMVHKCFGRAVSE